MLDRTEPERLDVTDDVIIVGGGLAGLFCALRLAPRPVTVLAAAPIGQGASSAWAQGGIAAAMSPGDSAEKHLADTLVAGAGTVDEKIARLMVGDASARIHDLLAYGVPFDHDLEGHLALSREAAHSERRIVHVRGDMAGAAIMQALVDTVRKTPSIRLIEGYIGETLADRRQARHRHRRAADRGRLAGDVPGPRHRARDRRHRPSLCGHHQPAGVGGRRPRHGGARRRDDRRSGIRPVPPDRDRHRPRPGAARHRGAPRRRREADQRRRRALHARDPPRRRACAARRRGARDPRRDRGRARGLPRLPRGDRRRVPAAFPDRLQVLHRRRHRPGDAADPDRAGRAFPHGRHPHRRQRPHHARRPLGLRRDRRRPAPTAPTGSRRIRCSRRWSSPPAPPTTSRSTCRRRS